MPYPCCCNKECESYSDDEAPAHLTLTVAGIVNQAGFDCASIDNGVNPLNCTVFNRNYVADLTDDNTGADTAVCATIYEAQIAMQFCTVWVTATVSITFTYARQTRNRSIAVVIGWGDGIPFGFDRQVIGQLDELNQDPYTLADLNNLAIPVTGTSGAFMCNWSAATLHLSA